MAILTEGELERLCGHFHAYGTESVPAVVMRDLVDTLQAAWAAVETQKGITASYNDEAAALARECRRLRAEVETLEAKEAWLREAFLMAVAAEKRYELALRILAGLPDGAGHTHSAELHGVGEMVLYAMGVIDGAEALPVAEAVRRGVLAGAEAGDVAGAIAKGEERDAS
jgi:hypothetical protein